MRRYPYTTLLLFSILLAVSVYGMTWFSGLQSGQDTQAGSHTEMSGEDLSLTESSHEMTEVDGADGKSDGIKVEVITTEAASDGNANDGMSSTDETGTGESTGTGQESTEKEASESGQKIPATVDLLEDALFIGDSRTVGLMEYGDLGEAEVFADTGMSAFKVMDTLVKVKSGGKKTLQEVLQDKQFGKVYIMLGLNELGYPYNSIISKYKEVVELVQQYQPDALIFLEANLHVSAKRSATSDVYNNAKINQLNDGIKQMADSSRIFYLDINPVFDDADGNLDSSYTVDDSHVLGKYYDTWSQWIVEQTAEVLSRGTDFFF